MGKIHFDTGYRRRLVRYFGSDGSIYDLYKGSGIHLRQLPEGYPADKSTSKDFPLAHLHSHFIEFHDSDNPVVIAEQVKLKQTLEKLLLDWKLSRTA